MCYLSHRLHLYGRSPVCIRMCCLRWLNLRNAALHTLHVYGRSRLTVLPGRKTLLFRDTACTNPVTVNLSLSFQLYSLYIWKESTFIIHISFLGVIMGCCAMCRHCVHQCEWQTWIRIELWMEKNVTPLRIIKLLKKWLKDEKLTKIQRAE